MASTSGARRLLVVTVGAIVLAGLLIFHATAAGSASGAPPVAATGAPGTQRTTGEITAMSRATATWGTKQFRVAPPVLRPRAGLTAPAAEQPIGPQRAAPSARALPIASLLAVSSSFDGPTLADAGYFPPDSDAAAGTSQVLVAINGRIRVYAKNGTVGALDSTLNSFFSAVLSTGATTTDPRVVFDTITKRWFVSAIDVPPSLASNRVLLAVSDTDTITSGTAWTFFQFQHDTIGSAGDTGDFGDFPTLGVDQNAVYVGLAIFTPAGAFFNTSIFVIQKASVLGAGPIVVTPFRDLIAVVAPGSAGIVNPQGATNGDSSATAGYIVGTDWGSFGVLNVRRVSNPGSNSPSLSVDLAVNVNSTFYPGSEQADGIRVLGSSTKLSDTDDRLSAAMIQNGKLYVAHAIGIIDSSGTVASFASPPSTYPTRTGARWYELTGLSTTPTAARQGTVFDNTTDTNPKSYWMPSISVSKQGHAVIGMSSGGAAARPNGAVSSMLSGQSSFATPVDYTATAANYNVGLDGSLLRWGDYSMTTVDPCDGQTFWTIQEYVPSLDTWGVKVGKVPAPGPATPATLSPSSVATGQASVDVTVPGTSSSGSGFWDPGSGSCRIAAAVTGGVTVNSVTFTDATHITLNVSTVGATAGTAHNLTITNPDGQIATKTTALTVNEPPANGGLPTLSATTFATGSIVTAAPGTWTGFPSPTFTYQFERCDSGGASCVNIGVASTTTTYLLASPADTGSTIRVKVTAANGQLPNATADSAATVQIQGPPVNTLAPALSGTATSGSALSTTDGTWTAFPAPTFAYAWFRCDAAGANCAAIAAQTASSYTLVTLDVGKTIRSQVTATNARGSANQQSAQSTGVTGPPINTALPTISGIQKVGSLLTAGNGTWGGFPAPTFTYQWRRCDTIGANCVDIGSATASTYTLVSADGGKTIRVKVTAASSIAPTATAESAATGLIAVPPLNTGLPTITGTAAQGSTLTAAAGAWDGVPAPTFSYQWLRCDGAAANCSSIAGGTSSTFALGAVDASTTIRVDVTGTNASGSATARSAATSAVTAPPGNTALPTVSGLTQVGSPLASTTGTWTGFPAPTFTYQWRRCDSAGLNCLDIGLATASSYTSVLVDAGVRLRVAVTGTNSTTFVTAVSAATAIITVPPGNTTLPSITGTAAVGQVLTGADGIWTGSPSPSFTRQWRRCDLAGNNCVDIAAATGTTYTLVQADAGSTIRFKVTATNANGTTSAVSAQTAAVTGPPANTALPIITGIASRGQTVTASTGTWLGYPTPTFTYKWIRCDSSGAACLDIGGATASTYGVVNGDVGSTLRVVVTASNGAAVAATSVQSAVVTAAPLNTASPVVTGVLAAGSTLTTTNGTWDASPAVSSYSYQWFRCNDLAGNGCVAIGGATASTVVLVQADVGKTIRSRVTASNGVSPPGTADSAVVGVVTGPPANTTLPTITGTTAVGDTLTAGTGTWSGYPAPTFAYQWRRCDSAGANCVDIAAATATTYIIVVGDAGHMIRVAVTATNGAGSASATSAGVGVIGPPVNLTAPTITGTPETGATLTALTGSWLGIPVPTFTYQWERCNALGAACADIGLATASTYVPTTPDLGLTLRVKVSASNLSGAAGPVESAQTAAIAAPPPPPPSGGGGGGGGGGAPDLAAGISGPATANIGDTFSYQVTAQDIGVGGTTNVIATITLPTGIELQGTAFDRGQGCTGTSVVVCRLDFLDGPLVAHVRLDVRVVDAGTLVTTVVLAAAQTDVAPANNTASVTTIVAKPIVVLPAPRLARTGTTTVGPVRRATLTTVGFGLSLNRPASVRMTVLRAGASRALLLRAGTRVGSTAIVTNARALSARVDAGRFSVKAVLGSAAIVRGRRYIVTVVATTPDAATSTVTVRFTG